MKEIVIALLTTMINSLMSYPEDRVNKNELIRGLEIDLDYIADLQEEPLKASKVEDKYIRELEDENENLKAKIKGSNKVISRLYEENINKNNEIQRLKQRIDSEKAEREKTITLCKTWQKTCIQLREKLEMYEGVK